MKKILLVLALAVAALAGAQTTTRQGLKPAKKANTPQKEQATAAVRVQVDTIVNPGRETIELSRYDKPLRSRRETFFALNRTEGRVVGLAVTITYFDTAGHQIHAASQSVATDIPAGESRLVSLRSWDTQQSFYYTGSGAPARATRATPYTVQLHPDTLLVQK